MYLNSCLFGLLDNEGTQHVGMSVDREAGGAVYSRSEVSAGCTAYLELEQEYYSEYLMQQPQND